MQVLQVFRDIFRSVNEGKERNMDVYKRYRFYDPLYGESMYPWYPALRGAENLEEVTEFIMDDVSATLGSSSTVEVDAGQPGRIAFQREGLYHPKVEYRWS